MEQLFYQDQASSTGLTTALSLKAGHHGNTQFIPQRSVCKAVLRLAKVKAPPPRRVLE